MGGGNLDHQHPLLYGKSKSNQQENMNNMNNMNNLIIYHLKKGLPST